MEKKKLLLSLLMILFVITLGFILYKLYIKNKTKLVAEIEICTNCEMKIPKIIHRIWIPFSPEYKIIPEEYQKLDVILKENHKDWQFMEWDEEKLEKFVKENFPQNYNTYMSESYKQKIKKHDASRYFVLKHFGGVFIQHSFVSYKDIEPLFRGAEVVFSFQKKGLESPSNSIIGSIKNHKLFDMIIENLDKNKEKHVLQATGPNFLTRTIKQYLSNYSKEGIKILDNKYMFPFDWNSVKNEPIYSSCTKDALLTLDKCRELFPEMYGYINWKGAWIKFVPK